MKQLLLVSLLCVLSAPTFAVTIGNKDWLQVTDSVGYSYDDFASVCDLATGACSGSLDNGANAFDVDGLTWASVSDVLGLFTAFHLDPDGRANLPFDSAPASLFLSLFDTTFTSPTSSRLGVFGVTREPQEILPPSVLEFFVFGAGVVDYQVFNNQNSRDVFDTFGTVNFIRFESQGGWFFRASPSAVPEPGSLVLLSLGLVAVGLARRRQYGASFRA